jgi:hypothetical protein
MPTSVLDLVWFVPLALIGMAVTLGVAYVVWSVPIWALEAIQNALRLLLDRRARLDRGADVADPTDDGPG